MMKLLKRVLCLVWGHREALHWMETQEGKFLHAGTYCTSCHIVTFPQEVK